MLAVAPKPFAVAQCALSTRHKTAVQTADIARLQKRRPLLVPKQGYLCYLGTFEIVPFLLAWLFLLPLGSGVIGDYLLYI